MRSQVKSGEIAAALASAPPGQTGTESRHVAAAWRAIRDTARSLG